MCQPEQIEECVGVARLRVHVRFDRQHIFLSDPLHGQWYELVTSATARRAEYFAHFAIVLFLPLYTNIALDLHCIPSFNNEFICEGRNVAPSTTFPSPSLSPLSKFPSVLVIINLLSFLNRRISLSDFPPAAVRTDGEPVSVVRRARDASMPTPRAHLDAPATAAETMTDTSSTSLAVGVATQSKRDAKEEKDSKKKDSKKSDKKVDKESNKAEKDNKKSDKKGDKETSSKADKDSRKTEKPRDSKKGEKDNKKNEKDAQRVEKETKKQEGSGLS